MTSSSRQNSKITYNDIINEKGGRQTPIKTVLASSSKALTAKQLPLDPLEEMRKKIEKILTESNEQITLLSALCSQVDLEFEDSYSKVQEEYSKGLDVIYAERMVKIDDLNEKYEYDLYKVREYYQTKNDDNGNSKQYKAIIAEKEKEAKEIDDEWTRKKEKIQKEYDNKIIAINLSFEEKRRNMNQEEFFKKMKNKINAILDEQPGVKAKKEGSQSSKGGNDKGAKHKK